MEERIEADLELGRHGDVIGELEALVGEHPLRETFRRRSCSRCTARPPGGGARGVPGRTHPLHRRARNRARRGAQAAPGGDPSPGAGLTVSGGPAPTDEEAEIVKASRPVGSCPSSGSTAPATSRSTSPGHSRSDDRPVDLARVSQYVATMQGSGPLYDELHARFEAAVEPGPLHRFLARLPTLLREHGAPHQLIVTTNYDLALERAFEEAGEELDIVAYVASGTHRGRFWHRSPESPHGRSTFRTRTRRSSTSTVEPSCSSSTAPSIRSPSASGRTSSSPRTTTSTTSAAPSSRRSSPSRWRQGSAAATSSSSATRWPTGTCGSSSTASGASDRSRIARGRCSARRARSRRRSGAGSTSPRSTSTRCRTSSFSSDGSRPREREPKPESPYKGLNAIEDSELDALLFFRRERETEIVVANLIASRLTVLYGPSGVGKSSLLGAAVARCLRALPERPLVVVFSSWSDDPSVGVAEAVAEATGGHVERLRCRGASTRAGGARRLPRSRPGGGVLPVPRRRRRSGIFREALPSILAAPSRVNVLVSLREDSLAKLDRFTGRVPGLFANTLRLDRLDRQAARAAIVGPVDRYGELTGGE